MINFNLDMKYLIYTAVIAAMFSVSSCEEKACADPDANNFNNEARTFDNSNCTYDEEYETIYIRMGGIEGVTSLVDEFLANILTNEDLRDRFIPTINSEARFNLFRHNLIDMFCEAGDGPCQYKGQTMAEAHTGMDITKEEFDLMIDDLTAAMAELGHSDKLQFAFLKRLWPMEEEIIEL